ncbi:hypothetical protein YC2023_054715 [Brassica napus]
MEKKKSDESRPPLMALNHVSRLCMDVKKSLEFLTSGFVETERAASLDLEGAWLFSYGVGIHLVQVKDEDKNGPSWTITSRSSAKTWKLWKRCSRKFVTARIWSLNRTIQPMLYISPVIDMCLLLHSLPGRKNHADDSS